MRRSSLFCRGALPLPPGGPGTFIHGRNSQHACAAALSLPRVCAFSTTTPPHEPELVRLRVDAQTATITLHNPAKLNPLTEELGAQFQAVVQEIVEDKRRDIRCVVLTGAGKAFSAGGDLKWLQARAQEKDLDKNIATMRAFYSLFLSLRRLPIPVVTAINGSAIGAGLCLAMATDIRIAAQNAKLGFTFATLGLHPGMAGTFFLPRLVPFQTASRLLLTGEVITGEEACRLGLVAESVPQDQVVPRTHALAAAIARASPMAVRSTLQTLRQMQEGREGGREGGLERALQREAESQALCYESADYLEGLAAVQEKRPPVFPPFRS